jgi:ABC-type Mn2+/Zn2+ transport system ATPase subunit
MLIEATSAAFGYTNTPVISVGALALRRADALGIFGPNGSGKTTLIKGLTGLIPPLAGTVRRADGLRIGYLPQHRAIDLHWPMTALDAASLAASAHLTLGWVHSRQQKIRAAMNEMDVDSLAKKPFSKLSGGQQQRILLAGALAADPAILLLDEPTDGLDVRSATLLIAALKRQIERGLCVVIISHDVQELLALAQTVAWVHPAADLGSPATVEQISASQLLARVSHARSVT